MHPTLARWFDEYADAHRHPTNRLTHKIAIPLIVFHVLAMLDWVKLPVPLPGLAGVPLSLGHLGWLGAMGFYVWGSPRLAAILGVLTLACFPLAAVTPKVAVIVLAVAAWVIQLAGHAIWEKNQPAFLKNLLQALVGPLFFVALLTGDYPRKRAPSTAAEAG